MIYVYVTFGVLLDLAIAFALLGAASRVLNFAVRERITFLTRLGDSDAFLLQPFALGYFLPKVLAKLLGGIIGLALFFSPQFAVLAIAIVTNQVWLCIVLTFAVMPLQYWIIRNLFGD